MKHQDGGPPRASAKGSAKGSAALAEVSLLLAVFFVSMDVVSVKYALEGLPPLVFMPIRYVLAGLLLLATLRPSGWSNGAGLGRGDLIALASGSRASPSTTSATWGARASQRLQRRADHSHGPGLGAPARRLPGTARSISGIGHRTGI